MRSEEESKHQTPPTCDLFSLLLKNRHPTGAVNEVWPNLFIGDAWQSHCGAPAATCCKQVVLFGQLTEYEICTFESRVMHFADICFQRWQFAVGGEKQLKRMFPSIISYNICTATDWDKTLLKNLEITHVVNAADGPQHIDMFLQKHHHRVAIVESKHQTAGISTWARSLRSQLISFMKPPSQKGTKPLNYIKMDSGRDFQIPSISAKLKQTLLTVVFVVGITYRRWWLFIMSKSRCSWE